MFRFEALTPAWLSLLAVVSSRSWSHVKCPVIHFKVVSILVGCPWLWFPSTIFIFRQESKSMVWSQWMHLIKKHADLCVCHLFFVCVKLKSILFLSNKATTLNYTSVYGNCSQHLPLYTDKVSILELGALYSSALLMVLLWVEYILKSFM